MGSAVRSEDALADTDVGGGVPQRLRRWWASACQWAHAEVISPDWRSGPTPLARLFRVVLLAAILYAVAAPGIHRQGGMPLTVDVALIALASAGWLVWALRFSRTPSWLLVACLAVCGTAGALVGAVDLGPAFAFACMAVVSSGAALRFRVAFALACATITTTYLTLLVDTHATVLGRTSLALVLAACLLGGTARGQRAARIEQTELLLAETQLAHEEQARAAALDERARIAREIHDVLAHSLSALAVQLELVDALLDGDRTQEARGHVRRSRRLTAEGLAETRRAIAALRDDSVPLPELLGRLAEAHRIDAGVDASVEVVGPPRQLPAAAGLALYRAAQESFTNARKHAPGAAVSVRLAYEPDRTSLTVRDTGPTGQPPAVTVDQGGNAGGLGGGYGLVGMRERAELAGGTLRAGPVGAGWSVDVTIPV